MFKTIPPEIQLVVDRYIDIFQELGTYDVKKLLELVTKGDIAGAEILLQMKAITNLPDAEFLDLKRDTGRYLEKLAVITQTRKELAQDIFNTIPVIMANILLGQI